MEAQDTGTEARGPSYVNIADTAALQPRYSLRSTDKGNRRESSVTRVDPHHCAIDETEKQHSSPPQPRSPDLTVASLPGDNASVLPSHTLTGDRSVDVDVDISPLEPDSVVLPASANRPGRSDSWQSNVNISSPSAFRVMPVDDEVQFYCCDARTPIAPQPFRYGPSRQSSRAPSRQSAGSVAMDPFLGVVNKMMEAREADMERREAIRVADMERQMEKRETEMRERMRLEMEVAPVSYTHLTLPTNREV